ncbi:TrgA family protein [Oceaniglobus ichthyenteri]|uniref:TrgA family protein n=1 Tax=Oceaniglobus ichthyenteri TaxID=2136177 RepID=UPI000D382F78|nr:TrgA family protein [Oceaniglobus ichthyenteri]
MYPTAAKLIAGLLFAALAFFISGLVIPNIPFGQNTPISFGLGNAAIGFLLGWRVVGRRAGEGYAFGIAYGITAAVAIVFWCLFLWAFIEMIERALDLYYDDPTKALEEMVRLMVDFSSYLVGNNVLPALGIGTVFCSAVVEWVGQKNSRPAE